MKEDPCQSCGAVPSDHLRRGKCGSCYWREDRKKVPCSVCGGSTGWSAGRVDEAVCRSCQKDAFEHGTHVGYMRRKCRCTDCKLWNAERMRAYVAGRRTRDPEYRTAAGGRSRSGEYARYGYTPAQRRRDERRRARERSVPFEEFDAFEIFERDNWQCGICGDQVDRHLAYPDPMSASLDHVVPLSLGGPHLRENTRCSHLQCNLRRGNRE